MSEREIKIFPNVEKLNEFAAKEIVEICNEAISERGQFSIALSGGSTPKALYKMLASEKLDWTKVFFFFSDERNAPPDSEESNFRMAKESLFSKIDVPPANIHRFLTEHGNAEVVAEKMENEMREFFGAATDEFPRFDLILLGMGADAHTASLFPKTAALKEKKRWVTENYVEKFKTFRLTFTVPTINNSRNVIFLIAGEDKAEALKEVLRNDGDAEKFPSKIIKPKNGNLLFLLDENAAQLL